MKLTTPQKEVIRNYPDAIAKRVGVDNGASATPCYVIFKVDSIMVGDALSAPFKKASRAWENAYKNLNNSHEQK